MGVIHIEVFKSSYVKSVFELEHNIFKDRPWSYDSFLSEVNRKFSVNLVAIDDDEVLGYLFADLVEGECHISNLAVHRKHRREGIAKALLKKLLEKNPEKITLEVRKNNIPATIFYKKNGFSIVGIRKNFYTNPIDDALLMLLETG